MSRASNVPYLFPEGASLGVDNVVLRARAKRHKVSDFAGPLSIKTVLVGNVAWLVAGRELLVDQSSFLVLNAGERYSMDIDTARPVETCCVFFRPGFVERVALDASARLERTLDVAETIAPALPFLSRLHDERGRGLASYVQSLAPRCLRALAPSGFEEDFLLLAYRLLGYYEQIREQAARVPAARESTRRELFRRLVVGRDFIHSHSAGPISLREVARAACLSPFHFHRGFHKAFGETPHTYITGLRLERARTAIEAGETVTNACLEAGFISPSAFSRLFRARYGEAPSAMRRRFARSGKKARRDCGTLTP